MNKTEAFHVTHSEQARVNRQEHLYPLLRRAGAIGAIALGIVGGAKAYEMANEHTLVGETTVTIHNGETAITAVSEGNEIIAQQHGYDPQSVSGVVEQGQKIGSYVSNGQQIEVSVLEDGFGNKSVNAADPTNIPR